MHQSKCVPIVILYVNTVNYLCFSEPKGLFNQCQLIYAYINVSDYSIQLIYVVYTNLEFLVILEIDCYIYYIYIVKHRTFVKVT